MKGSLTKVTLGLVCLYSFLTANENISRSLHSTSLSKPQNHYTISKDAMKDLQRKAIVDVGKSLSIDTSMFDKRKKFSLYLKVSRKSKFGFKYKF